MPLRSRHFSVEKAFDDFPISTAWELLANTDHLNRTIGLPAITFDQVTVSEEDFYRAASAKTLGIQTVRWKEYPFEWIRDRHYAVLRVFENGPFTRFYGGIEFTPAMEIQGRAAAFNRENQIEPPIIIKVGIHHGAAIAVNSNDRLDYFGRTVNIAARIQPESVGGDVVMMADLFADPAIQETLKKFQFEMTPFRTTLKGVEGEFELCRLTLVSESE